MRNLFQIPSHQASPRRFAEDGFSLPEVLVSAIVMVLIAIGTLTALSATGKAGSEERNRTQAHSIAQEDQARMRTLQISELGTVDSSRTVVEGGRTYTVASKGEFVTDPTSTESCTEDTSYADYVKMSSTVTWPSIGSRPPVVLESIVAPPNGSLSANRGNLAVSVVDASSTGKPGVTITGSGASNFSGVTGENGCVVFSNIPIGNYSVSVAAGTLIDPDGNPPQPQTTTVVAQSTNTVVMQYDTPGAVQVADFRTRSSPGGSLVDSAADTIVVFNTAMSAPKLFGTPGIQSPSIQYTELTATPVFPFTSPVSVFAGACEFNNPTSGPGIASATVTSGNTAVVPSLQLPALHLTVWSGRNAGNRGSPLSNVRVRISDKNCLTNGVPFRRTFFTNSSGNLPNSGLPWGVYDICAQNAAGNRARTITNRTVKDYTNGTTLHLYTANAPLGTCA